MGGAAPDFPNSIAGYADALEIAPNLMEAAVSMRVLSREFASIHDALDERKATMLIGRLLKLRYL
jgi:hypothetical protein